MWWYGLYRAAMERDSWWALVDVAVWAYLSAMYRDIWWELVNVAVWAVSSGYREGQMVGPCECGGMGCIEML